MAFKALERKGRITVVSQVTYQNTGSPTSSVTSRYSLSVLEDEQKYERPPYTATEEWMPLDKGWVNDPGMVVIQNGREGWIQVGINTVINLDGSTLTLPSWNVPPGGDFRGVPVEFSSLRVRAKSGTAKFTVNVFPK